MAMDQAKGLFHRAVVQSGARLANMDAETAAEGAAALVEQLGLSEDNVGDILTLPPERIEVAANAVVDAGAAATWSGPVFDGHNFALYFAIFCTPGTETVKTNYFRQVYFRTQLIYLQTFGNMSTNRRYDVPTVECLTYGVPKIIWICYKI